METGGEMEKVDEASERGSHADGEEKPRVGNFRMNRHRQAVKSRNSVCGRENRRAAMTPGTLSIYPNLDAFHIFPETLKIFLVAT